METTVNDFPIPESLQKTQPLAEVIKGDVVENPAIIFPTSVFKKLELIAANQTEYAYFLSEDFDEDLKRIFSDDYEIGLESIENLYPSSDKDK